MENVLNILLVEDTETDADLLIRFLKKEIDLSYLRVEDRAAFIKALEENEYDLIIADQVLPQFSGIEAFRISKGKNIPFILITGSVSEALLTEYAKEGIDDYILKNNLLRLPSAIKNAINKKKIERLHQELKIAYKDIKNSINYAKIIQEAMLPEESVLYNNFPDSFIFYKPKDILSGDFYWFKKVEDVFSIAVADCTGHGIPGALLSMMGFNILYEAVATKKIIQPSDVLDRLNKQVRRILKHGATTLNDGMDIVFCTIDLKNKILMYAGANRPLFIERGKKLMEFKPDKISIGGIDNNEIQFTNHSIPIKAGDRIFLFSDGYVDQFSDKTDKKITIKRLRKVLIQSAYLSIKEQKEFIIRFFEKWKGNNEQVDDVLLMCIQIP
jgi:serine phosphatase RsbU (regulator of sigma subunit)